jgi:anti-anti-sigma factor
VKCYEITRCSDKEREQCFVWNSFKDNPQDFENLRCWVLKGMYQAENKGQAEKCKKCNYYVTLNRETGIAAEFNADIAVVSCAGVINNEKTHAIEKVWETLKSNKKYRVIFDITNVNTIYSSGLGVLVKIHKEALAMQGMLVIVVGREQLHGIFHSTGLTKIFHLAPDKTAAAQYFSAYSQQKAAAAQAAAEAASKAAAEAQTAAEAAKLKQPLKKFVRCYEYWNNQNPKNATTCDECFNKLSPTNRPCWVVDGLVEGVSFQFINDECVDCNYFEEYGLSHKATA